VPADATSNIIYKLLHTSEAENYMTSEEIKDLILEIIEDIDDEADFESLDPDQPLRDQLDLDSMDFLDIVMELRKRHKLQIPEEDYPNLASLNSCVKYLGPLLKDA
jgi:acyl carrier protein